MCMLWYKAVADASQHGSRTLANWHTCIKQELQDAHQAEITMRQTVFCALLTTERLCLQDGQMTLCMLGWGVTHLLASPGALA